MSARYLFLPWARVGTAASLTNVDTLDAGVPGRTTLPVTLRVNDRRNVTVTARLHGPGDVVSIDTRMVVRTDPPHLASEFEPNYFPLIEFDRPDLPWMFTPATGDARGRLRPWLTLVVLRQQSGVQIVIDPASRRPVLRIDPPARPGDELPDLADSWAWAHAQVVRADAAAPLDQMLAADSRQNLSRILCPRRLASNTSYLACLVPAFDAGRKSGLGLPLTDGDERELVPAWQSGENAPREIALPVYYHWEFSTGEAGDFESLASRLRHRPLPAGVGTRPLSVRAPGFGLPDVGERRFRGALRLPQPLPEAALPDTFETGLARLLGLPEMLRAQAGGDPVVAPPLYGSRHAATSSVARAGAPRPWLAQLNLDPALRAAAGLGVLIVQDQQESLMASAWEQLGEAGREVRQVHQPAFAQAVLQRVHVRLAQLSPDQLLALSAPLHAKVRLPATALAAGAPVASAATTLQQHVRSSRTPAGLTSTMFRRAVRPHGPLVRRTPVATSAAALGFITHVAITKPVVFFELPRPDMVTPQLVADHLGTLGIPSLPERIEQNLRLRQATDALQTYFAQFAAIGRPLDQRAAVAPELVRAPLLGALDPAKTVRATVATGTQRAVAAASTAEALQPVLPGPSFPQPMYAALRDLDPDLLLPGADRIPQDSVVPLESDAAFIEAFMVGLNHEMSRELAWREYPSDERSTSFRTFWAAAGLDARVAEQMPPIHQWTPASTLGSHFMSGTAGNLVLLFRGELLNRYPGTTIYITRSEHPGAPGAERVYPLFRGRLGPDTTFVGFGETAVKMRSERWFVVLEQQPTEPRFGLDASTVTGRARTAIESWNDLAWGDLAASDTELAALTHVRLAGRLADHRIGPLQWGSNAAHMAAITLQRAFRVALRFSDLLPQPSTP